MNLKKIYRTLGIVVALTLVSLANAHATPGGIGTCSYSCQDTTTGKLLFEHTSTSFSACCSGTLGCPTGSTFVQSFGWNGQFFTSC